MKILQTFFSLFLTAALILTLLTACSAAPDSSLGIPYRKLSARARVPWDLCLDGGYLYVGAGDYDQNLSPCEILRYSLANGQWESVGAIADEQINRFVYLGDTLAIPGTDPTGSWERGAYYVLQNGAFVSVETIPHAVHNFDMVLYDGMLFAALGVDNDTYPVVVSRDNGASFETVPLFCDGKPVSTQKEGSFNRIYDFFLFDDRLYLLYYDNLYGLMQEDGQLFFTFLASWENDIALSQDTYVPITAKAAFANSYFFTTQEAFYRCRSENGLLGTPQVLTPLEGSAIHDLYIHNNTLYLLAVNESDGENTVTVLSTTDGEHFSACLSFSHRLPAASLAVNDTTFYIGLGEAAANHKENGTILFFERSYAQDTSTAETTTKKDA